MATPLRGPWEKYLPPQELGPGDPYGIQEAQIEQTYGDLERRVADAFRQGNTLDLGAQAAWKRYQDAYAQPMPQQGLGSIFDQGFGNIGSVLAGDQQFGRQAAQRTQQNLMDARQRQAMQVDQLMNEYNRMIAAAMEQKKYAEAFELTTKGQKLAAMGGLQQLRTEAEERDREWAFKQWQAQQNYALEQEKLNILRQQRKEEQDAKTKISKTSAVAKRAKELDTQITNMVTTIVKATQKGPDGKAAPEGAVKPLKSRLRSLLRERYQLPDVNEVTGDFFEDNETSLANVWSDLASFAAIGDATSPKWKDPVFGIEFFKQTTPINIFEDEGQWESLLSEIAAKRRIPDELSGMWYLPLSQSAWGKK